MTVIRLYAQLASLPMELQKKVAEYIDFLTYKAKKSKRPKKRRSGLAEGLIQMRSDFDAPMEDFQDYM